MADDVDLNRAADAIDTFLRALGVPVDGDPELKETGRLVAEAFHSDLLSGYRMSPKEILSEGTAAQTKGLVILSNIPTMVMCPHHLLPARGVSHVGYVPSARVVGLGALGKLVDCFSRRLILQELATQSIADALVAHLDATEAMCQVTVEPMCVNARGNRRHQTVSTTTSFAGQSDATNRALFVDAIRAD